MTGQIIMNLGPAGRTRTGESSSAGLATATRHPGMAVAIAHLNFPQQKLATPAIALYLIISAIVAALASRKQTTADQASTQMTRRMAA
jgi:hypothetical protein